MATVKGVMIAIGTWLALVAESLIFPSPFRLPIFIATIVIVIVAISRYRRKTKARKRFTNFTKGWESESPKV
jgi:tetrahydromethanopterin S-methyltransferase subunit E